MAITINSIKCPECGATLPIEEGRTQIFCSYCGTKIIITNENEYVYRHIDEAGVKQAETEQMIRLRELELEAQENTRVRKSLMLAYGTALAFVLGGALVCIFKPSFGIWGCLIGFYIAMFTYIKSEEKEKILCWLF